jgi:hypothetical protein
MFAPWGGKSTLEIVRGLDMHVRKVTIDREQAREKERKGGS